MKKYEVDEEEQERFFTLKAFQRAADEDEDEEEDEDENTAAVAPEGSPEPEPEPEPKQAWGEGDAEAASADEARQQRVGKLKVDAAEEEDAGDDDEEQQEEEEGDDVDEEAKPVVKLAAATVHKRVLKIYEVKNPDKVGDVAKLMAKYKGKEMALYDAICKKYEITDGFLVLHKLLGVVSKPRPPPGSLPRIMARTRELPAAFFVSRA